MDSALIVGDCRHYSTVIMGDCRLDLAVIVGDCRLDSTVIVGDCGSNQESIPRSLGRPTYSQYRINDWILLKNVVF